MAAPLRSKRRENGRDRRRHRRFPVTLAARVVGANDAELEVAVLNLSRGGALLSGPAQIKSVLFQPKRYTHRPVTALISIADQDPQNRRSLLGRCRYLQKLPDGSYRAGFGFAQLQPMRWVLAVSARGADATRPPARPRQQDRPQGSARAPGG